MIQKARVRWMPRTGLGNKKRTHEGVIYLSGAWLAESVVVLTKATWLEMVRETKATNTKLKNIKEMCS